MADETGESEFNPDYPVVVACPEPFDVDWELQVLHTFGQPQSFGLSFGRVFDTDGDAQVDENDSPFFVSTSYDGAKSVQAFDYGETLVRTLQSGLWSAEVRLADIDSRPGMEVIASWYRREDTAGAVSVLGVATSEEHPVPKGAHTMPWIADFSGDGEFEVAIGGMVVDIETGDAAVDWGAAPDDLLYPVAIDLDRDGVVENISATWEGRGGTFGLIGTDGELEAACFSDSGRWSSFVTAVANFDGDEDGEFLVAGGGRLVLCDTDGHVYRETSLPVPQPALLAVGNLDEDPEPEIVVSGRGVFVFDHELQPLWSVETAGWMPLSLADLDANGKHEIIAAPMVDRLRGPDGLVVYSGDGTVKTRWAAPSELGATSWRAIPIVVDVDQDGASEIVIPGDPSVVLENGAGGFASPGTGFGWSGVDHFPGALQMDGRLDTTSRHWVVPGYNGWNARPTCVWSGD